MKNLKTNHGENNRSPLSVGATFILSSIVIIFMILATHSQMDSAATKNSREEAETVCTTSSIVTTEISSTTSSTTSSTRTTTKMTSTTTTTSTTTSVTTTIAQESIVLTEPVTEPPAPDPQPEPVQEYVEPQPESQPQNGVVCAYSESDIVLLAQLINKEASASWEGKLAVGSCVLNRANANGQTISQVIYSPGQFSTCWNLGYYTQTDYDAALQILTYGSTDTRIYYFDGCHPDFKNWFYDGGHNYLYAA